METEYIVIFTKKIINFIWELSILIGILGRRYAVLEFIDEEGLGGCYAVFKLIIIVSMENMVENTFPGYRIPEIYIIMS